MHRTFTFLLGLILLIWGQHHLLTEYADLPDGLVPVGIGLVAIGVALWGLALPDAQAADQLDQKRASPPLSPSPPVERGKRSAVFRAAEQGVGQAPAIESSPSSLWRWARIGLLLGSVALAGLAGVLAHRRPPLAYGLTLGLWAMSIAAFAASTLRRGELRTRWEAGRAALNDEGPWWVAVGGVTVAALVVRVLWLNAIPPIFSFDEGSFAQEAAFLWDGTYRATPFGPAWLSHPRLFFFMLVPSIGLLGRTALAARLPVAMLATLTIPAVYGLGRELFGRRIGLMAAIFLAGWNVHLHFSRLTLNNIIDPLFGTLAFLWTWRALRTRRLSDWALAGLALGFSQYFYAGARLLPIILIAWLAVTFFLRREEFGGGWRDDLIPGVAVLVLAALVITWPADWHLIAEGAPPTTRLSSTGLFQSGRFGTLRETMTTWEILTVQVKWAWLALIHTHDNSGFYGGVAPIMGRLAGVPLLIGMAWTTLRLHRRAAGWLLVFWLAATIMAGSALLVGPPHYARYILLLPAAALLVALGIEAGFRAVASLSGEAADWATGLPVTRWGAVAAAGILMIAEILFYFNVYIPDEHSYAQTANNQLGYTVARLLEIEQKQTPDLTVYYLTAPRLWLNHSTLVDYFAPGVNDTDLLPDDPLPDGAPLGPDTIFILTPERSGELVELRVYIPDGVVNTYQNEDGEMLFLTFRAPER